MIYIDAFTKPTMSSIDDSSSSDDEDTLLTCECLHPPDDFGLYPDGVWCENEAKIGAVHGVFCSEMCAMVTWLEYDNAERSRLLKIDAEERASRVKVIEEPTPSPKWRQSVAIPHGQINQSFLGQQRAQVITNDEAAILARIAEAERAARRAERESTERRIQESIARAKVAAVMDYIAENEHQSVTTHMANAFIGIGQGIAKTFKSKKKR